MPHLHESCTSIWMLDYTKLKNKLFVTECHQTSCCTNEFSVLFCFVFYCVDRFSISVSGEFCVQNKTLIYGIKVLLLYERCVSLYCRSADASYIIITLPWDASTFVRRGFYIWEQNYRFNVDLHSWMYCIYENLNLLSCNNLPCETENIREIC